jgi:hypothetical protein
MRVALSSVNSGSKENPIASKNAVDLARSFTGRLMKVCLDMPHSSSVLIVCDDASPI